MEAQVIRTRKNGMDLFKFLAAFFVVVIHADDARLNQEYAENLRLLGRWVAPYFFMLAGFFLGYKIENDRLDFKRIQKNISMLISVMIVADLIFLVAGFFKESYYYRVEDLLMGTHFHLWFIGSLLFGYFFIWYVYYIKKAAILKYLSVLLVILALISDSYDLFLGESFRFSFYKFLWSIPFMYVGIYLSKKKIDPKHKRLFVILIFAGLGIQYIEAEMFESLFAYSKYSHQFLIGSVLVAIPLFMYSTVIEIKENTLIKWAREYSIFVYLYHPIFYLFLMPDIENRWPSIQALSPVIVFLLSLFMGILLHKFLPRVYNVLKGNLNG